MIKTRCQRELNRQQCAPHTNVVSTRLSRHVFTTPLSHYINSTHICCIEKTTKYKVRSKLGKKRKIGQHPPAISKFGSLRISNTHHCRISSSSHNLNTTDRPQTNKLRRHWCSFIQQSKHNIRNAHPPSPPPRQREPSAAKKSSLKFDNFRTAQ